LGAFLPAAEYLHTGLVVAQLPELAYHWRAWEPLYQAEIGLWHNLELIAPGPGSPLHAGRAHICYEVTDLACCAANLRATGWLPTSQPVQTQMFGTRPVQFFYRQGELVELVQWQE
jgi:hypothetical protein